MSPECEVLDSSVVKRFDSPHSFQIRRSFSSRGHPIPLKDPYPGGTLSLARSESMATSEHCNDTLTQHSCSGPASVCSPSSARSEPPLSMPRPKIIEVLKLIRLRVDEARWTTLVRLVTVFFIEFRRMMRGHPQLPKDRTIAAHGRFAALLQTAISYCVPVEVIRDALRSWRHDRRAYHQGAPTAISVHEETQTTQTNTNGHDKEQPDDSSIGISSVTTSSTSSDDSSEKKGLTRSHEDRESGAISVLADLALRPPKRHCNSKSRGRDTAY